MEAVSTRLRLRVAPGAKRASDSVTLVSGHGGRDKIVQLTGMGLQQIERRLSAAAEKERRA